MAITFVAAGTTDARNNAAPTPGLPAGIANDDLMIACFYSRESVDGTVSISGGWTELYNTRSSSGLIGIWYRLRQTADTAPTFTLGGHAAGDSVLAVVVAFRGVDTTTPIDQSGAVTDNASAQNIGAIAGVTLGSNDAVVVVGCKQDDWTSVATLSGDGLTWAEAADFSTTLGVDAGLVVGYAIDGGSGVSVTAKTFTVTGGTSQPGKGVMFTINAAASGGTILRQVLINEGG